MYPSGYKANKIYSQKPTNGTGDLTFTRASTATRVNSSGLIESVASGVPRIDYLNGCGQLLLEPQRTNLITYSEDLGTLKWFAQNGTLVIGGSGLLFKKPSANSIKYEATGVGYNQMYFNNGSNFTTIGNDYAERFYLKVGSDIPYIYIQHSAVGGVNFSVINNITKTIKSTNVNVNSFDVEFLQDDWMLITTTLTATYAVQYASKPYFSNSSTSYSNGVPIGTTAYMTCSQFEEGSHATSYISTAGSTVTRLQDVSYTTGLSSIIGQSEGTLHVKFEVSENITQKRISLRNASLDKIDLYTTGNNLVFEVPSYSISTIIVASMGLGTFNVAIAYKVNDWKVYVNGVSVYTNVVAGAFTDLSILLFANNASGFSLFAHRVNELTLYQTRLDNVTLAALTTI